VIGDGSCASQPILGFAVFVPADPRYIQSFGFAKFKYIFPSSSIQLSDI
jgi:hypothetical protein